MAYLDKLSNFRKNVLAGFRKNYKIFFKLYFYSLYESSKLVFLFNLFSKLTHKKWSKSLYEV